MSPNLTLATILIQIVCTSVFICICYFTYGVYLEKKSLQKQVSYLVSQLVGNPWYLPSELKQQIANQLQTSTNTDNSYLTSNEALIKKVIKYISIFVLVIIIILIFILRNTSKDQVMNLIKENLLVLVFVMITYIMMATFTGTSFLSADPDYVKQVAINTIYNYVK